MDFGAALSEVKSLPDSALRQELQRGYLPGFLVLGEMQERKALRASAPVRGPRTSMASQQLSKGGLVAQINPFGAYTKALKNQRNMVHEQPEQGLAALVDLRAPSAPTELGLMVPQPPGEPKAFSNGGLVKGIYSSAAALGIDPLDLATAISYETGGTFNPMQRGPTTKWGQHQGLIQFGGPQRKQFGVDMSNPEAALNSQLGENGAVVKYLKATGVKPGHGMLDVYSAINAGGVGRYNASDAAAGGAPGTVRDKVMNQMAGHRAKAANLLGTVAVNPSTAVGSGIAAAQGSAAAGQAAGAAAAPTSPLSGLMSLMALSSMKKAPAPPTHTNTTVPRPRAPVDPELITEETSETPDWYRRRRLEALYG